MTCVPIVPVDRSEQEKILSDVLTKVCTGGKISYYKIPAFGINCSLIMNLVNSINQCCQPVFYFSWHVRPLSSTPTSSIFLHNDAQADHFIRATIKRLNEVITTSTFFFFCHSI